MLKNRYLQRYMCLLHYFETDGKEHSESQNEQQVLGSNQNDRSVNLSACSSPRCKQNLRSGLCFQFIWFHVSHGFLSRLVRAKRKAGRTTKKLLTLTLTCTPCFSWRQVRRLRIHFESYLRVCPSSNVNMRNQRTLMSGEIKITFNRQGCGRNSELVHELQIPVAERVTHDMTMHCVNIYSPLPSTQRHRGFPHTYFTHPKVCQGGMRVNLAGLTVPL